jgi:hypothetical protein
MVAIHLGVKSSGRGEFAGENICIPVGPELVFLSHFVYPFSLMPEIIIHPRERES